MANSLTQNQLYTVLNSIAAQATGNAGLTATDTSSFVTVADVTLKSGYDNVISAISQVLSRTIFSNRSCRSRRTIFWLRKAGINA